jgi:hypothetical protein
MSVARISGPKLLDAPLRSAQQTVDVQAVGVSADLGRDPARQPHQGSRQRPIHPEGALERREAHLRLLPHGGTTLRPFGRQQDAALRECLLQRPGAVGEVPEEPARTVTPPSLPSSKSSSTRSTSDVLAGVSSLGEGNPVGRADEVQLYPVEGERTPPHPRATVEPGRLGDLPGMQDRQERRIHHQRLRVTDELGHHDPSQRLQESAQLPNAAVEGRRMQSPATPGKRWAKNLLASLRKDLSLSMPLSCWKRASARTSESESRLSEA